MSSDMKPLEEFGAKIGAALGDGPSDEQLMIQRRDFLAQLTEPPRISRRQWAVGTAVAAAIVAVALGVVFKLSTEERLPFRIGTDPSFGEEGQWVRSENTESLPIRFQGGSVVTLSKDGAARIITSTTDTVRIDLAVGNVHCNINGNHKTVWQVEAGPYTVKVTGTIFTTSWNPKGSKLDVSVERGSVIVTGADLNERGVELTVGDRLQVDDGKALTASSREMPAKAIADASLEQKPDAEPLGPNSAATEPRVSIPSISRNRNESSKKDNALLNAETNLDEILAQGDVEALWQVAMQARYNKNGGTAKTVLLTIRDRFKESKRAETAAFLIGRVMLELQGNPSSAAEWFKRYLDETPSGPLAEEALGRLFDAYDKSGRNDLAHKFAAKYLDSYPKGLFADSAEQVLND
jgi:TolA-binding protein